MNEIDKLELAIVDVLVDFQKNEEDVTDGVVVTALSRIIGAVLLSSGVDNDEKDCLIEDITTLIRERSKDGN